MLKHFTILLFYLFVSILGYGQSSDLFCDQVMNLQQLVQNNHYQPKTVNDSLSANVFDLFLEGLDENKRLFTQNDIKNFEIDRFEIDDYVNLKTCGFVDKYTSTLSDRISQSKQIISDLATQEFDYSGKDTLHFKPEIEFERFKDEKAVQRYWNKRIRFEVLRALIENDSVLETIQSDFKNLETQIKPKIIQKEICKLDALENRHGSVDAFVKQTFLNAYLQYQDPNSSFFTATEKDMFENSLSNNQFSFGLITAKTNNGDIVITHITPGGAAFQNGNFEVNDVIKSLKFKTKTFETYCVSNDDVKTFTSHKDHDTIIFKIKKQNGSILDIELSKTLTKTEENSITGFILEKDSKVGYINIPSFYSNFDSPQGMGLANDVAKELHKLKKENIEGLILDLRFNGGGSMKEAADLSGMFINRGPLSILKFNTGETTTIKDLNRGALFTKPIVVLVNNYSASASEFFAATMQDYNRAVIVGSTTHGKASAQVILNLGQEEGLGYSKITIEKFYRITGQSHQSQGVIPDIVLPNLYEGFNTQEQFEYFALENDSIAGVRKFPKLKELPIDILRKNSDDRIKENFTFSAIGNLNQLILDNYFHIDSQYLLTLDNVYHDVTQYRDAWNTINAPLDAHLSNFEVKNSAATKELLSYDSDKNQINDTLIKDIKNDIYIEEAQAILQDLLLINSLN